MRKVYIILSAVSLLLLAMVNFGKNALETYYRALLSSNAVSFKNSDFLIYAKTSQYILFAVFALFAILAIVDSIKNRKG